MVIFVIDGELVFGSYLGVVVVCVVVIDVFDGIWWVGLLVMCVVDE